MVRLTGRPDMTLDVYRGRKITTQQQQQQYTTLPHNLIKHLTSKLSGLLKRKVCHTLPVIKETRSLFLNTQIDINISHVKICVKP